MDLTHINTELKEGKLLLAALVILSTTSRRGNTPGEIMSELDQLQDIIIKARPVPGSLGEHMAGI